MNCTFTGRTLIRARKTENAKEDSETLREVMKLCGAFPVRLYNGDMRHRNRQCSLRGMGAVTAEQWAALMGVPEPAIVYESLTIKEAKEHLVKGITYAQRANEASGLYKPKLNPKMGEQQ